MNRQCHSTANDSCNKTGNGVYKTDLYTALCKAEFIMGRYSWKLKLPNIFQYKASTILKHKTYPNSFGTGKQTSPPPESWFYLIQNEKKGFNPKGCDTGCFPVILRNVVPSSSQVKESKEFSLNSLQQLGDTYITQHHMWDNVNLQQDLLVSEKTLKSALTEKSGMNNQYVKGLE